MYYNTSPLQILRETMKYIKKYKDKDSSKYNDTDSIIVLEEDINDT